MIKIEYNNVTRRTGAGTYTFGLAYRIRTNTFDTVRKSSNQRNTIPCIKDTLDPSMSDSRWVMHAKCGLCNWLLRNPKLYYAD